MGAPGRVDVVVAVVPAPIRRVHPPFEFHGQRRGAVDFHRPFADAVLGAASEVQRELARGKEHGAAVGPVDLLLKEQVRPEPFRLRREHVPGRVFEREPAHGRRAIEILHVEFDGVRGLHVEQDGHLAAEAEVLIPLADVEADGDFPLARFARINQGEGVFDAQAAQLGRQRRAGGHLDDGEALHGLRIVIRILVLPALARVNGPRLGADDPQRLFDRALVDDFHEHGRVPGLLNHGRGGAAGNLNARLGVDRDDEQAVRVECGLDAADVRLPRRGREGR